LLLLLPNESTLTFESFCPLIRDIAPFAPLESIEPRGDRSDDRCIEGKMSFFCLLAGNISSRSTGTPRDTRKSLRIRDLSQSGGAKGGGATSCEYNDKLRSERNLLGGKSGADCVFNSAASGNILFIYGRIASLRSSILSISLQSIEGIGIVDEVATGGCLDEPSSNPSAANPSSNSPKSSSSASCPSSKSSKSSPKPSPSSSSSASCSSSASTP